MKELGSERLSGSSLQPLVPSRPSATNAKHIRAQRRLIADHHAPIDRRTVHRIVATTARKADIATPIPTSSATSWPPRPDRGMRLEAIAALLGHRSMEMMLTYAQIADRVVADEYEAVTAQIDALYNTAGIPRALPAEMRRRR